MCFATTNCRGKGRQQTADDEANGEIKVASGQWRRSVEAKNAEELRRRQAGVDEDKNETRAGNRARKRALVSVSEDRGREMGWRCGVQVKRLDAKSQIPFRSETRFHPRYCNTFAVGLGSTMDFDFDFTRGSLKSRRR